MSNRWSKSQRELIALSAEPIDGFAIDMVMLHQDYADLVKVIKHICAEEERKEKREVRQIRVCAQRFWDALMTLRNLAGTKLGSGYLDQCWHALDKLAPDHGGGRMPLVIWLEETRMMKVIDQEGLVMMLEMCCHYLRIPMRVVMLLGKSRVWIGRDEATGQWIGARRWKILKSEKLVSFAREWTYQNDRLSEVPTPLLDSIAGAGAQMREVKSA